MSQRTGLSILVVSWVVAAPMCLPGGAPRLDAQSAQAARTPAAAASTGKVPNLEGIWDYRTLTPLERPAQFAGKEFLTEQEIAEYQRRASERGDGRPPDDARTDPSVHPVEWLDYGKKVVATRRSSLIVDPSDGRIPPRSEQGRAREDARRAATRGRGVADDPENRSLWERCITRGIPDGMLPGAYNNNLKIIQTPNYVILLSEMIHDARIVPIDGRPHAPSVIRSWMGDSIGRYEGQTLVVDTTNFSDKASFRGSSSGLHLVERFTRVDENTLDYRFTVEDPSTWTRPWTVAFPMAKAEGDIYEYACHEGNHGLRNIMSQARAVEKAAAATAPK